MAVQGRASTARQMLERVVNVENRAQELLAATAELVGTVGDGPVVEAKQLEMFQALHEFDAAVATVVTEVHAQQRRMEATNQVLRSMPAESGSGSQSAASPAASASSSQAAAFDRYLALVKRKEAVDRLARLTDS